MNILNDYNSDLNKIRFQWQFPLPQNSYFTITFVICFTVQAVDTLDTNTSISLYFKFIYVFVSVLSVKPILWFGLNLNDRLKFHFIHHNREQNRKKIISFSFLRFSLFFSNLKDLHTRTVVSTVPGFDTPKQIDHGPITQPA